uniref:Uncharacterized protein n=1 Tax=Globodera rostochiensis TaxID=31243 RepID=A0A914H4X6_GLORO
MCLTCSIRQDEGSFIFKQPMSNKMIVLTRCETSGEEGIRVSQHENGRIFRESYIPSDMENWMVKSLLRGLSFRTFAFVSVSLAFGTRLTSDIRYYNHFFPPQLFLTPFV